MMTRMLTFGVLLFSLSTATIALAEPPSDPTLPNPPRWPSAELFVYDNGIRCESAPCPSHTVILAAGNTVDVSEVIFRGTSRAIGWDGLVVVGYLRPDIDANVLVVESVVGGPGSYDLELSGVRCFTDPCPYFTATDLLTAEQLDLAGFEVRAMGLGISDEELYRRLHAGGIAVQGYVAPGSWSPGGPGDVLYVTGLVTF